LPQFGRPYVDADYTIPSVVDGGYESDEIPLMNRSSSSSSMLVTSSPHTLSSSNTGTPTSSLPSTPSHSSSPNLHAFICPIPLCTHRAKSRNGLKYHVEYGHRPDKVQRDREKVQPTFVCPKLGCRKVYRQLNGLNYHLSKGTCEY